MLVNLPKTLSTVRAFNKHVFQAQHTIVALEIYDILSTTNHDSINGWPISEEVAENIMSKEDFLSDLTRPKLRENGREANFAYSLAAASMVAPFVYQIIDRLNKVSFPTEIYRAMRIRVHEKLDNILLNICKEGTPSKQCRQALWAFIMDKIFMEKVGKYWSFVPEGAIPFSGDYAGPQYTLLFTLVAEVEQGDVDWLTTMEFQYTEGRDLGSDEVRLLEGIEINIDAILFNGERYECKIPELCQGKV
jgi:hypothetical protein